MNAGVNTFVHVVKIKSARRFVPSLDIPGVVTLPESLPATLVVRVTNPASQMGVHVSMAKEVAGLAFVRQGAPHVPVPDVYAWSADKDWGYMVLQHLPGLLAETHVDICLTSNLGMNGLKVFEEASLETKAKLAPHFANLLKDLQSIPIPEWTHPFGGFSFDQNSQIVTGPHPLGYGGPYQTVFDYQRGMFDSQLVMADANDTLQGWRASGIRERIETFRANPDGLEKVAAGLHQIPAFSHFDLGKSDPYLRPLCRMGSSILVVMNLLVDPETMTITRVVDLELSHVGLISDEFMNGLGYVGPLNPNMYDPDEQQHSAALLSPKTGLEDSAPMEGDGAGWANRATVRAFEHAFAEKSVSRPRTITGFEEQSRLYWFCRDLCQ
jgi:hypothetical protein